MTTRFDAEAAIARLAEARPQALALGEIVALAASVDRRLLRKARRALTGAGPEAEADLYFSELVLDRNPARFVFRPEAALALRRRLAARPADLERAWALVSARHATLPPTVRTEELLQWHALKGDTGAVRDLLRACVSTLVEQGRQGFAAWAIDAVARMDPLVRDHEEYRMLGLGAAMRTGARPQQIAALSDARLAEWLEWLAPDTGERTELGFTLVEGGIEFGPAGDERYSRTITLPGRFPQLLDIREAGGKSHALTLRANAPAFLETASNDLVITTEDGTRLRVRSPGQRFVKAGRRPRVPIAYEVETNGVRRKVELPFVIGVLGDFAGPGGMRRPLEERYFLTIDTDNFDSAMTRFRPMVRISVPDEIGGGEPLSLELRFESMADFTPDAIVRKVPQTLELIQARDSLHDLLAYLDGKDTAQTQVGAILANERSVLALGAETPSRFGRIHDEARREARRLFLAGSYEAALSRIESFLPENPNTSLPSDEYLLGKIRDGLRSSSGSQPPNPASLQGEGKGWLATTKAMNALLWATRAFRRHQPEREVNIKRAIVELCGLVSDFPQLNSGEPFDTIDNVITLLDRILARQVNHILADPAFRRLESTWRGLDYLVGQTETGPDLKIRLFDIAEDELFEASQCYAPLSPDGIRGALYRNIYEAEFGHIGGEPFTAILCDFAFGNDLGDLAILQRLGSIGEIARTYFIAPVAPGALDMDSWQEIANPRELAADRLTLSADRVATQNFRQTDASRHIVLTMPGVVARAPYSNRENPLETFAFDENGLPPMMNAGWALGACITRACATYGWPARIRGVEGGGVVSGLPAATLSPTDDGSEHISVTEVLIGDRREAELSQLGLLPLISRKNSDEAVFIGSQTLHRPAKDQDPEQSARNHLASRLPYQLVHARFAHCLMCMTRDRIGNVRDAAQVEADLQNWIDHYVSANHDAGGDEHRATYPLKHATLSVSPDTDAPGYYAVQLDLMAHYQLEGLDVSIPGRFWLPAGS
jgi:type VI secretion system protein ImpC